MRRNQPVKLVSLKTSQTRHPAPSGNNNTAQDGFSRLSQAEARTGVRQPIGGTPVWPAYHEDQ